MKRKQKQRKWKHWKRREKGERGMEEKKVRKKEEGWYANPRLGLYDHEFVNHSTRPSSILY
jgi:hypothetical protein